MACVDDKGELSPMAKKLLKEIETISLMPQEISKRTGMPVYRIRISMRELKSLGYVIEEKGERFIMNPKHADLLIEK